MKIKKIRLTKNSIWDSPITRAIQDLAYEGFTHRTIAQATGTSTSCVQYRLRRLGVKTQDVRGGKGEQAKERILRVLAKRRLSGLGKFHRKVG